MRLEHPDPVVRAGDPRERRGVLDRLPKALRSAAVETARGGRAPGSASPGTHAARPLDQEVDGARARHARERGAAAMERFPAGRIPSDGHLEAAEGVPALVDAAREHRIGSLLIRPKEPDLYREVWVGTNRTSRPRIAPMSSIWATPGRPRPAPTTR
ncbi:hypothetical protein [Streptomyces violaceusniger]|uniref:Uncharacterized protein n=1 Tax=Streptomyces violaceusniger (strain Tu 4113) TaxID=653045 RepID=G2PCR6_STRV4|nr:hypothetical protein [Streptomyces violaceusniger]AEM82244.1 hypothetical protein Strvi_2524 [Streptomyces violaceusniger Tu 4113]